MAIPNRYKNSMKIFIDSLIIQPLNMPILVDKRLYNIIPGSEDSSTDCKLEKNKFDKS